MTTKLNARVGEVTERIAERSRRSRQAYLARIDAAVAKGAGAQEPRLRQFRPWLRRLRRRATRRRCGRARAQSRHRHRL